MKLDTAIELIKEAQKIEENHKKIKFTPIISDDFSVPETSKKAHDECLRIARRILLENYYERNTR